MKQQKGTKLKTILRATYSMDIGRVNVTVKSFKFTQYVPKETIFFRYGFQKQGSYLFFKFSTLPIFFKPLLVNIQTAFKGFPEHYIVFLVCRMQSVENSVNLYVNICV